MPAMRKKERSGPGIATVTDSGGPTLASSDDKPLEGVEARTIGAKHEPIAKTATVRGAARRKNRLPNSRGDSGVKRSVQAFKIASPVRFIAKTT